MQTTFPYLAIDRFLATEVGTRALALAFETGLIDSLSQAAVHIDHLPLRTVTGRSALAQILSANNVADVAHEQVHLTSEFRDTLVFRDLMEAKIAFLLSAAADVAQLFPHLLDDIQQFMARSKTFQLFRYDRCLNITPDNIAATKQWMRFTTSLTRYEGQALAAVADFSDVRTMLDVGGNSGELALQLCRVVPNLQATVFDLPVVCFIGREHAAGRPEASRISFAPGDMRKDELPGAFDLVTLKSVLHDWPEGDARALILKAARSVKPGGRLLIFERGPMTLDALLPFSQLTNLVFLHFFRSSDLYAKAIEEAGLMRPTVRTIPLDVDFHLIVAESRAS